MKKVWYLLVVVLMIGLVGCGTDKPDDMVENTVKCLQKNQVNEAKQYFYYEDSTTEKVEESTQSEDDSDSFSDAFTDIMNECAEENSQYLKYEVVDSTVNGDAATVTVEVTYKNAGPVAKLALNDLISQSISSAFSSAFTDGGEIDNEDMSAILIAAFEKEKENAAIIDKTETLEINCKKTDKGWKISNYETLLNIYYCNILDTLENMFDSEEGTTDSEEGTTDNGVDEADTGLENVSEELKVLEENGFDTSILTTEEQVIVAYAKFVAVSSVDGDGITPTRTMDDIISEIFEYGFASDLSDYNSYEILNYYIDCEIYKGITTTAAEIIDEQYDIGDGWAAMEQVDSELASDITYFKDNDLRDTTMSFTYWDEANEATLDLTYTGEKGNGGYVGNFNLHLSSYNYDTEQTETLDGTGTFVEDVNGNGTLTFENGEAANYYLYWSDDHDVLTLDLDGETMDLLEASWAYDNVG